MKITIFGEVASKANSRKTVVIKGRPASIKSSKARKFAADAEIQLARYKTPIIVPVKLYIRIFYMTERNDLDESLVLDVLQGHCYLNDRQVRERHVYHGIDAKNPRVEIIVEELNENNDFSERWVSI